MPKIIFINPSTIKDYIIKPWDSKLFRVLKGGRKAFLSKLAGMILAAVTPETYEFSYVDEEIEDIDFNVDTDLVAITVMTEQAIRAYRIAGEFRKRGKTVVIGGIHAAVMREEAAQHCDAVMVGEGENTWPALLEDFENGTLKTVYDAKDYPPVKTLVSPRVDIIKHDRYLSFPIQATRGCPYDCDFCSIKFSSGRRYRMKPTEQVVKEILEYEKYNQGGFAGAHQKGYYFVDDNLYVNRKYVKELLTALIPLKIKWDGQGTVNMANDEEILTLMAESGCRTFGIGFESISSESLAEANKPKVNKVEEYETAIRNIARHGITPVGFFVFGFDNDDITVFRRTLEFIKQSVLVEPTLSVLTPYPGTQLHERLSSRIFNTFHFLYNSWNCVFTPKKMTAEDLQSGTYWVGLQTTELGFVRKQLKKFWRFGPWKNNPSLTISERVTLIFLGVKLGLYGLWAYQRFLFWAAFQRNAADFKTLIWILRRHELASIAQGCKDPAARADPCAQ